MSKLSSGVQPRASYNTVKVEASDEKKLQEEILCTLTATNETKHAEQKEMSEAEQTQKNSPQNLDFKHQLCTERTRSQA